MIAHLQKPCLILTSLSNEDFVASTAVEAILATKSSLDDNFRCWFSKDGSLNMANEMILDTDNDFRYWFSKDGSLNMVNWWNTHFTSCLNFWDEAWWFLSLRVFGQLSSSLLLFP